MEDLSKVRKFYFFKLLPLLGFVLCIVILYSLLNGFYEGGGFYVPFLINICFAGFFGYLIFHYRD